MDVMRTSLVIASLLIALAIVAPIACAAAWLGCPVEYGVWCAAWLALAGALEHAAEGEP